MFEYYHNGVKVKLTLRSSIDIKTVDLLSVNSLKAFVRPTSRLKISAIGKGTDTLNIYCYCTDNRFYVVQLTLKDDVLQTMYIMQNVATAEPGSLKDWNAAKVECGQDVFNIDECDYINTTKTLIKFDETITSNSTHSVTNEIGIFYRDTNADAELNIKEWAFVVFEKSTAISKANIAYYVGYQLNILNLAVT